MYPPVETKDPTAVEAEVQSAYLTMFPHGDKQFVARAFGWAVDAFTGNYADYQAVDAQYHDFEHTLQGTLCFARLLRGRHLSDANPPLNQRVFQLGLLAILLHDTGYLKKRGDDVGTGAKYTVTHVERSADFAEKLLTEQTGFSQEEIKSVKNMIRCTGINAVLDQIPFQSELEKTVGFALGTADLLGQMAAEDYIEKLPILYAEFAEAATYSKEKAHVVGLFSSVNDLMQKTPVFWEKYVQQKLNRDFAGLYRFLNAPFPFGPNYYLERIEANMECLRLQLAAGKGSSVSR
ncbi:MAG: hypothetical protein JWQ71_4758 [Pedosphaera sp.]|nr:hypothetical protein [Pedosphaera sp.]